MYNQKTTLGIINTYVTMLASGNSLINDAKDQGVGIDLELPLFFKGIKLTQGWGGFHLISISLHTLYLPMLPILLMYHLFIPGGWYLD